MLSLDKSLRGQWPYSYMTGVVPYVYVTLDCVNWLQMKSDTMKYSYTCPLPPPCSYPRFPVTLKITNRRSIQVEGVSMPFRFMFSLDWGDTARRVLAHAFFSRLWLMVTDSVYWKSFVTFFQSGVLIWKPLVRASKMQRVSNRPVNLKRLLTVAL
jgi:hypothetical protein